MRSTIVYFCLSLLLYTSSSFAQYKQNVVNKAVLVQNAGALLTLKRLDKHRLTVVTPFPAKYAPFVQRLQRYAGINSTDFIQYEENTKYSNTIIVAGT